MAHQLDPQPHRRRGECHIPVRHAVMSVAGLADQCVSHPPPQFRGLSCRAAASPHPPVPRVHWCVNGSGHHIATLSDATGARSTKGFHPPPCHPLCLMQEGPGCPQCRPTRSLADGDRWWLMAVVADGG